MDTPSFGETGRSIYLRFSLQTGLNYNDYIGVVFPSSLGASDLGFDTSSKFACSLSTGSTTISMTAQTSATTENSIAFCQLTDKVNSVLTSGVSYKLTLTLSNAKISTAFVRNVGIFTATSNTVDRVLIDSSPAFGNLGLYTPYKTASGTKALDIDSIAVLTGTNTSSGPVYIGGSFTLQINLKVNSYLNPNDYYIVIRYPTTYVASAGTTIATAALSTTDTNKGALKATTGTTLAVQAFGTNGLLITNIDKDDLFINRNFQITISTFKATTTPTSTTAGTIEVLVFYKNTYSVYSYASSAVLTVNKGTITHTVDHPEKFPIIANGAWPLTFSFQPNTDLPAGGYVQVKQQNYAAASATAVGQIFSFIASTCDFSDTSFQGVQDNNLGKRNNCYSLYTDGSNTSTGSGIFFYFKTAMSSAKSYTFTVWGYVDQCGALATAATNSAFNSYDTGNLWQSSLKFTVTYYSTITTTGVAESDRFAATNILADSSTSYSSTNTVKCYNARVQVDQAIQGVVAAIDATTEVADTKNTLHFREVTDFMVLQQASDTGCDGATCYGTDVTQTVTTALLNQRFLYSGDTTQQLTNSYFLVRATIPYAAAAAATVMNTFVPVPLAGTKYPSGKLIAYFSKLWFTKGKDFTNIPASTQGCYLSWANTGDTANLKQKQLLYNPIAPTASAANTASLINYIGNYGGTSTIDSSSNNSDTTNTFKIVSQAYSTVTATTTTQFTYFYDAVTPTPTTGNASVDIAFFTSCFKWKSTANIQVTSIHAYLDVMFVWQQNNAPAKTIRFIKLFPEGGVLQDNNVSSNPNKVGTVSTSSPTAIATVHFSQGTLASGRGICLVEVLPAILGLADTNANVLSLALFNGVLIESDYTGAVGTYPAGTLVATGAIGLQSGIPMTMSTNAYTLHNTATATDPTLINYFGVTANTGAAAAVVGKTTYHNYMGSLFLVNGISSGKVTSTNVTQNSLFFPFYCPLYVDTNTQLPKVTIVGNWLKMTSHAQVDAMSKFVIFGNNIYGTIQQVADKAPTAYVNKATLRFTSYNTSGDTNLYLYNNDISSASTTLAPVKCSGHVLLLNKDVAFSGTSPAIDIKNLGTVSASGIYNPSASAATYYTFGVPFYRAGFISTASTQFVQTLGSVSTLSNAYITGIARPDITTLVGPISSTNSSKQVSTLNKIGYFCHTYDTTTAATDAVGWMTNLYSGIFVLDWNPQTVDPTTVQIALDRASELYKNDPAGNLRISLTFPSVIPETATIALTSSSTTFNTNSICGILLTAGGVTNNCNSSSGISCTAPGTSASFVICCYNVVMSDTIALSGVTVTIGNASGSPTNGVNTAFYTASSSTLGSFTTGQTTDILTDNTKGAKITGMTYSGVSQINGIGKATIAINLGRPITRNAKITVTGDFTNMLVKNIVPRCVPTFSTSSTFGAWDDGDALLDTCVISGFGTTSTSGFTITTKNMAYKCATPTKSDIYVQLWPVVQYQYPGSLTTTNSFKVTLQTQSGTDIIYNSANGITMPTSGIASLSAAPDFVGQWDTLCAPTVTPRIPGAHADYVFNFDLDTNKASITNANANQMNEVTIYWPSQFYGDFLRNIVCYYKSTMVNCVSTEENVLHIRLPSNLSVGGGAVIPITVSGVRNPGTESDLYFACTANKNPYGIAQNKRTNIITGSGKLAGGIIYNISNTANPAPNGNLRFFYTDNSVADTTTRAVAQYVLRVGFDTISLPTLPFTISNTPQLFIHFPREYNLASTKSAVTVSIDEYSWDTTNNKIYLSSAVTAINPATTTSNIINVKFNTATYTFGANYRYWDIKISGIAGIANIGAAGAFEVILTNADYSTVFMTYSNLNNYSAAALSTSAYIDQNIAYNRGVLATQDTGRWTVNVGSSNYNVLTIKAGRYTQSTFTVLAPTTIVHAASNITLNAAQTDANIKLAAPSYQVVSAYNSGTTFLIGANCATIPGNYVAYFTHSNTARFESMYPIQITVDSSTTASISTTAAATVPPGGSYLLGITLTEINVEKIDLSFTAPSTAKNDASAVLYGLTVPAGSNTATTNLVSALSPIFTNFTITNSTATGTQQFNTASSNACFTWSVSTITFTISGTITPIPSGTNIASQFTYGNSGTDATITRKNSIKFTFTSPIAPAYIFCVLTCFSNTYPSDAALQSANPTMNSNSTQYYVNQISSTSTALDLNFNGLIRGQQYKLRCLLTSTHGDVTQRSSVSTNIESYQVASGSSTTNTTIGPVSPIATQCVQYNYTTEPGNATKAAIINYCQSLIGDFWNNGCILCTDASGQSYAQGLPAPNVTCVADSIVTTKTSLRYLQATSGVTVTSATNNTYHSVCLVQYQICPTDVNIGGKAYADQINALSSLNTAALINSAVGIANVPINTTVLVNDVNTPVVTNIIVENLTLDQTGAVKFSVRMPNNTLSYLCYWTVSAANSTPSFDTIANSTGSNSGSVRITTTAKTVSTNIGTLVYDTTYSLYFGCVNDVAYTQKKSTVYNLKSVNIPSPYTPPSNNTTSSGFINYSFLAILMMIALLFN